MKFNLLILSFLFWLTACGGKLDPNRVHESPKPESVVTPDASATSVETKNTLEKLKSFAANEQNEIILKKADSFFFALANWQNPKIKLSTEFQNLLDRVAGSVIELQGKKSDELAELNWWPRFMKLTDQLCDDDLKNCQLISTLNSSAQSAELMRLLAQQQTDLAKKYKYLFISLDIQNKNFPSRTVEDLLVHAKEYRSLLISQVEELAKSNKSTELGQKQTLLSKLNGLLSLIITFVQEGKIKTANTDWIRDLNLTNTFKESDTQLAAQYVVYEPTTKKLTVEFQKEIQKMQTIPGSFSTKRKMVETQNSKAMQSFDVKSVSMDEYFYVIDQVYTARWSVRQGDAFIRTAGLSTKTLVETAQNYLRTDIVYIMTQAQVEFKEFTKDYASYSVEKIIVAAKKFTARSATEARALPEKANKLSQLISLSAGKELPESNQFFKQVASIPQIIKSAVTYPYTAVLLYLSHRLGATNETHIEVIKFSGEGNPKLTYFIKNLFVGTLIPILDYTDDVVPLNSFEVMESFEMAAKTGLFENLGFNLDDITSSLYNLLTEEEMTRLSNDQKNLDDKYATSEWSELLQLCDSLYKKTPMSRTIGFTELPLSPTLGKSSPRLKETFGGYNGRVVDGIYLREHGYFTMSSRISDQLEWIRSDLFNTIQYFDSMQKIVTKSSSIKLPKLASQVENTKSAIKKFLTTLQLRNKEFDRCYFTIIDNERSNIAKIIKYEYAYWNLVHKEIKNRRSHQKAIDLGIGSLKIQLPSQIEYRTKIETQGVTSYNVDFFIRVKSYLKNGLPAAHLPAISPQLNIAWTEGLETQTIYRESKTLLIPYTDNEEEFARNALLASNVTGHDSQTFWFTVTYMNIYSFRDYYDAKAALYRMGPLAKKILNLEPFVTEAELIQTPLQVISHINQTTEEKEAMKLLRISSRYSVETLRSYGIFFDATNESAAPLYDYLLTQLSSKWMATFGHSDQWEDVRAGNPHQRPITLLPISTIGENFYKYKSNLDDHFALAKLETPSVLNESIKDLVQSDLKLLIGIRDAILEQAKKENPIKSISYSIDSNLKTEYYSSPVFDDVDGYINNFHLRTSGFYK